MKPTYYYTCNKIDYEEAVNLIQELNYLLNNNANFDSKYYLDKVSTLHKKMNEDKKEFIKSKELDLYESLKKKMDLEGISNDDLLEILPYRSEQTTINFAFDKACDKVIMELRNLLNVLSRKVYL